MPKFKIPNYCYSFYRTLICLSFFYNPFTLGIKFVVPENNIQIKIQLLTCELSKYPANNRYILPTLLTWLSATWNEGFFCDVWYQSEALSFCFLNMIYVNKQWYNVKWFGINMNARLQNLEGQDLFPRFLS